MLSTLASIDKHWYTCVKGGGSFTPPRLRGIAQKQTKESLRWHKKCDLIWSPGYFYSSLHQPRLLVNIDNLLPLFPIPPSYYFSLFLPPENCLCAYYLQCSTVCIYKKKRNTTQNGY